jgi:hypothetical protein
LKAAQKQRRNLDTRDQAVTGPNLVAEVGEVFGGRHYARDELAHAQEGVLEDQAADVSAALVLGNKTDTNR